MTQFIYKNDHIRYGIATEEIKYGGELYSVVCYDCKKVLTKLAIYPNIWVEKHEREYHDEKYLKN